MNIIVFAHLAAILMWFTLIAYLSLESMGKLELILKLTVILYHKLARFTLSV